MYYDSLSLCVGMCVCVLVCFNNENKRFIYFDLKQTQNEEKKNNKLKVDNI